MISADFICNMYLLVACIVCERNIWWKVLELTSPINLQLPGLRLAYTNYVSEPGKGREGKGREGKGREGRGREDSLNE